MSDLLAPILFVMQNEVDAFWCFVGYMDRVSGNFDFEAGGIKHQVLQSRLDPIIQLCFHPLQKGERLLKPSLRKDKSKCGLRSSIYTQKVKN